LMASTVPAGDVSIVVFIAIDGKSSLLAMRIPH
jgi:hypothetical protein